MEARANVEEERFLKERNQKVSAFAGGLIEYATETVEKDSALASIDGVDGLAKTAEPTARPKVVSTKWPMSLPTKSPLLTSLNDFGEMAVLERESGMHLINYQYEGGISNSNIYVCENQKKIYMCVCVCKPQLVNFTDRTVTNKLEVNYC